MSDDVLVRVENVSKRFCRSLKRSLWYGLQDLGSEIGGRRHGGGRGLPQSSADVQLRQDEFWASKDVSFEVRRGECLGLIGRNGAGKTTLLRMLNGLIKPDTGHIEMRGRIGALIALGAGFNPVLSGRENIMISASVLGLSGHEIKSKIDEIIEFAGIQEFIDSPVSTYSSGMQVRLGFSVASSLDPDILILDEVLAVGDAGFRLKCFNRVTSMLEKAAIIFVSHNMPQVTRISNKLVLLDKGRMLDSGYNMNKIIACYASLSDEDKDEVEAARGIKNVQVYGAQHDNCAPLRYGHPFSIVVNLSTAALQLPDSFVALVTISSAEGENAIQITERISLPRLGLTKIRLEFEAVSLGPGKYYVNYSLTSDDLRNIYVSKRNACSFIVEGDMVGYAPVFMRPSRIEIH